MALAQPVHPKRMIFKGHLVVQLKENFKEQLKENLKSKGQNLKSKGRRCSSKAGPTV